MLDISTDKERLDKEIIYSFLASAYWSKGRSKHEIDISIDNSLVFGVYKGDEQIGFARLVSDYAVFAYLMDVFIIESERGHGYGKELMEFILAYPPLKLVKIWSLGTSTAHDLYRKYGFEVIDNPENLMRLMR